LFGFWGKKDRRKRKGGYKLDGRERGGVGVLKKIFQQTRGQVRKGGGGKQPNWWGSGEHQNMWRKKGWG